MAEKKQISSCAYCGTVNNAHHSAECVDTDAGKFPHPLDMPMPTVKQWRITAITNTDPKPLVRIISGLAGVVSVSSEEI